jgi:hypothetical protein
MRGELAVWPKARRRIAAGFVVPAFVMLALAGCDGPSQPNGQTSTTPPVSVTPTVSRTPTPTAPPTDPVIVFAADGIGGYTIGASLSDLTARGLITHTVDSASCADTKSADTTGAYAGKVSLTFRGGKLSAVRTTSPTYVTPAGAKVGLTLTALQSIYGDLGQVITGQLGNKAYSVRVAATQLALVFVLDQTNTTVASISGGEAQPLEDAVRTGAGC